MVIAEFSFILSHVLLALSKTIHRHSHTCILLSISMANSITSHMESVQVCLMNGMRAIFLYRKIRKIKKKLMSK